MSSSDVNTAAQSVERARDHIARLFQEPGVGAEEIAELTGDLGATPKETIFTRGTLKLYRYRPLATELYRVPVLIVTSLVNKPWILDLAPNQSFVEYLLRAGFDVYMIDWGIPRSEHQHLRLEDYILDRIPQCIAKVLEDTGESELTIIGYCVGGLLSVIYAALHPDAPLKNLVCLAAPVNGHGLESFRTWMGAAGFDEALLTKTYGNVPAELVQDSLRALRPLGKFAGELNLLNNLEKEEFVKSNLRLAKWETDNVPFPAAAFTQIVNAFLRENALVRKAWVIGGQVVDLRRIAVPFLHVLAERDHITPYAASKDLVKLIGSADKGEIVLKGGHVGLVAGRSAAKQMYPALEKWLAPRSV
jgi:polyhydroxyalkanoate synthase subunit PhaC